MFCIIVLNLRHFLTKLVLLTVQKYIQKKTIKYVVENLRFSDFCFFFFFQTQCSEDRKSGRIVGMVGKLMPELRFEF